MTFMNTRTFLAALAVASFVASAQAQTKKPTKKPPVQKPTAPAVKGTAQLAGDNGQFETTYTLGKRTPLNVTVLDASYSILPFTLNGNVYSPEPDGKYLIINLKVQNPNKTEVDIDPNVLHFTGVDAQNSSHAATAITHTETKDHFHQTLKPGQVAPMTVTIPVSAKGEVPKLMIQNDVDVPVLRYDLKGKVKGFAAPMIDPADKAGATLLDVVQGLPDAYYTSGLVEIKYLGGEYSDGKGFPDPVEDDKRFFVAKFMVRNPVKQAQDILGPTFRGHVKTDDGEKSDARYLLKGGRDEGIGGNLDPGEERAIRVAFSVPK
jgi:hypothetical protein